MGRSLDQDWVQENEDGTKTTPVPAVRDRVMLLIRQPRLAFETFLEHHRGEYVSILFYGIGLNRVIDRMIGKSAGEDSSLVMLLGLALISAFFTALVGLPLAAWFLGVTGRWIGGKAFYKPLETVLAWSGLPGIATLIFMVPLILVLGKEPFMEFPEINGIFEQALFFGTMGLSLVFSIWSVVLLAIGLSVAHGFSMAKALGNLVIAFSIVLIPIALIALFAYAR